MKTRLIVVIAILACTSLATADRVEGHAGPGWAVLFGDAETEFDSLGPVLFSVGDEWYLGPTVAYEESSAEGPSYFLGGVRVDSYPPALTRGWYATSFGTALLAGPSNLGTGGEWVGQLRVRAEANVMVMPGLAVSAGPVAALHVTGDGLAFLPGIGFALKEGADLAPDALLNPEHLHLGGYWQIHRFVVDGTPVVVDGGGTRAVLESGAAIGIAGGVLRQEVTKSNMNLAIMIAGLTLEYNYRPVPFLTIGPRLTAGMALVGWIDAANTVDGGPHFMLRPELSIYARILPFLELGGGVGYQYIAGESGTTIPINGMSSLSLSLQVRVGRH